MDELYDKRAKLNFFTKYEGNIILFKTRTTEIIFFIKINGLEVYLSLQINMEYCLMDY